MVRCAAPGRRHEAGDAPAARRHGHRGERHSEPSGYSDVAQLRRHGAALQPIRRWRCVEGQEGSCHRLRQQRPRYRAGPSLERGQGHARSAQLDLDRQCRAERATALCALWRRTSSGGLRPHHDFHPAFAGTQEPHPAHRASQETGPGTARWARARRLQARFREDGTGWQLLSPCRGITSHRR